MTSDDLHAQETLQTLESENVRFVNLLFVDCLGEPKSVEIPIEQWEAAIKKGISFDGSSIRGFSDIEDADMYLRPDLDTLTIYPWRMPLGSTGEEHATAAVIADVYTFPGEASPRSPRQIMKRLMERAADARLHFFVGAEPEFFLFPQGRIPANRSEVTSTAGYFALLPADLEELTRKEIVASLLQMGIPVEKSHHEIEPHIQEVSIEYADPVTTADRLLFVKFVAKSVAVQHGLQAIFMPKPIAEFAASGMHLHLSLYKDGENAFYDPQSETGLSQEARFFIGGLIEHLPAISALTNPTINSYKRLVPGFEAPVNIAWAHRNRSALIRIPATTTPKESTRIELRSPDPSANAYLAFSAIYSAGRDGIERTIDPPLPVEENIYRMSAEEKNKRGILPMPSSLCETLDALEADDVIRQSLGNEATEFFVRAKRNEIAAFNQTVTEWERRQYLDA